MAFLDPLVGPSGTGNAWDNRRMFDAVQKQTAPATVRQFDSSTARDKAISTPTEGQLCYRTDLDTYQWYNGSAWVTLMQPGAWTSYTPTLTAVTTNPTLGTGSEATGRYTQIGKTVIATARFTFGTSGVNAGSGAYRISLPVSAETSTGLNFVTGSYWALDSSTNGVNIGITMVGGTATDVRLFYPATWPNGASVEMASTAPWTWAASDQLRASFTYQAA